MSPSIFRLFPLGAAIVAVEGVQSVATACQVRIPAMPRGRLSFTQRARFQLHVAMCKNCRRYLRQMRLTIRTLGKLPEQVIHADIREELMERFSYWKAEGRRWHGSG